MAEYRRFVAYVYEYQKGRKGSNCGFIKVEAWQQLCRMEIHLRCPGLIAGAECRVYGFVRKKGLLDGSRIGSSRTGEGRMDCVLETQTMAVGAGKISLGEMNGMILILDSGGFFGTEWDDQPIRPEDFREMPEITEDKETVSEDSGGETKEKETTENAESENEMQENRQNTGEKTEEASHIETVNGEEKTIQNEMPSKPEVHTQSVQESETAEYPEQPLPLPPSGHSPHRKKPDQPKPIGTPCEPFSDGELTDCRKITPEELCFLGRRACMLRNNRFLQYGYYNFGHLILCRDRRGHWILGVPGGYDQQERFMANMFGFSYFKESRNIRIPKGKGGYWYRLIDAPDLNV